MTLSRQQLFTQVEEDIKASCSDTDKNSAQRVYILADFIPAECLIYFAEVACVPLVLDISEVQSEE